MEQLHVVPIVCFDLLMIFKDFLKVFLAYQLLNYLTFMEQLFFPDLG